VSALFSSLNAIPAELDCHVIQ